MFKFAILVTLAVASYGASIPEEETPKIEPYILGGTEINITQAPYQVAMFSEGKFICGACVVAPTMLVTSTGCVLGEAVEDLTFRIGSTYLNEGGIVAKAKKFWTHPKYTLKTMDYDIAVVELEKPLVFSKNIQPIKLAAEKPADGAVVQVGGWGRLKENGDVAQILNSVNIPIVDFETCDQYVSKYKRITPRMICAGSEGKGMCHGDSPLVYNGRLVGVGSILVGCGRKNLPGIYANVVHPDITAFIREHAKI